MASNKAYERGSPLQLATPSTVKSGDPLVFGSNEAASPALGVTNYLVGVANEDAKDAFNNVKPATSFDTEGAFYLPVEGEAGCPLVGHPLKRGDPVYADIFGAGSTYDAITNCWTGFAINGNPNGVHMGWLLDDVAAFACPLVSANVRVLLKGAN